jgi:hypothetical protein
MPDAPKLRTLPVVIYEQTEAQWAVDGRVFDVNVVLVPTDGSNKGKHKLADGIRTYAELSFVENTSSGGDPAPFIYVTAGGDATGIYRYQFMNEGKRCYVLLGVTATPENLFNCVVWADPGTGLQWNVTDEIGEVLYTSASDVATPDLATGWTLDQGTGPLPSIAGYPGPTVQDVLEQIAAVATKASKPVRSFLNSTSVSYDGTLVFQAVIATGSTSVDVTTIIPGITSCLFLGGYSVEGVQCFAIPSLMDPTQVEVNFFDTAGDPLGDGLEVAVIVAYKL